MPKDQRTDSKLKGKGRKGGKELSLISVTQPPNLSDTLGLQGLLPESV